MMEYPKDLFVSRCSFKKNKTSSNCSQWAYSPWCNKVNQLLQDKCTNYTSVYFLKPDADWTTLNGGLNRTYYYEDYLHLLENGNKKLALSIKTKLYNIRVNCHEIAINEKEVLSLKTSDPTKKSLDRPDYRKATTTSFRNRQSNSIVKIKCQAAVTEVPT